MIKYLKVSNFLSFKEETVLNLESAGRVTEDQYDGFYIKDNSEGNKNRIGKIALIYGANASGKSNVLATLEFLESFIRSSYAAPASVESLINKTNEETLIDRSFISFANNDSDKSVFEISYLAHWDSNREYVYHLEIKEKKVISEWLNVSGKLMFNRTENDLKIDDGTDIKFERLNTYSSYISKAKADNYEFYKDFALFIGSSQFSHDSYEMLTDWTAKILVNEPIYHQKIVNLIKKLAIGLENIFIEEINRDNKNRPIYKIFSQHSFGKLDFKLESTGTKKLFNLLYWVYRSLESGRTFVIDEIGNCFHPYIVEEIVKMFLDSEINIHNAQLIATAHEPGFMDIDGVLKQHIYFTEKTENESTNIFRLTDFDSKDIRNQISLSKKYMLGKYGAVPNID